MRPLELTMSAFGAYANKQVIDFRALGKSGLYLITGDTGAGKTTIFDAISFALFGDASGDNREAKMLRSKLAEPDVPTYVELVFEYNGKQYTVKRNPEYERLSKRGEGTTKQTADASLTLPDGKNPISKVNEVTSYIEELFGINRNQFSQIAMIAQGEFQKLLNADSKDRREIFRKLFRTEKYNRLEETLKNEANQLKRDCEMSEKSIKQYIDGVLCDINDQEIMLKVENLKNETLPASEAEGILNAIIEKDSARETRIAEERGDVDAKITDLNAKIEKQEEIKQAKETLETKKAEFADKSNEIKQAEKSKKDAEAKKPEADELRKKATKLENEIDMYTEREECRKEFAEAKKKYETALKDKDENSKLMDELTEKIKGLKKEYDSLSNTANKKAKLVSEDSVLRVQISSLEKIKDELKIYTNLADELKIARSNYGARKVIYEECENEFFTADSLFLDAQAGILAEKLAKDTPCPVCGSFDHPEPAKLLENAPSKEELDKLKESRDNARSLMYRDSAEVSRITGNLTSTEKTLMSLLKEFTSVQDLTVALKEAEKIGAEIIEKHEKLGREISDIDKEAERRTKLEKEIQEKSDKKDAARDSFNNAEKAEGIEKTRMENAKKRGEILDKKLRFKTESEARNEINRLDNSAKQIIDNIDSATRTFNKLNTEIAELKGTIAQLNEQIEKAPVIDEEKVVAELGILKDKKQLLVDNEKELSDRVRANNRTLKSLEISSKKNKDLNERYTWLRNLSDTANGGLAGCDKILLEIYVQTRFFDRIIERANTRFFKMTGGQFELKRAENVANKTSQAGLDLNVIDHHNGSERSVKSLSGGESFMASLSLALGLSDEIQTSAGGIKLETMFIDEGFGTLDAETLKQAMDTLSTLADPNGGKLVGIISHVDELKNRIDKQIVVKKDKAGVSAAKIIV